MAFAKFENLYEVIGLGGGVEGLKSSAREIEHAYRRKARELHPDKNPGDPQATAKFQRLQSAFEVLKNESSRGDHDARLRAELERQGKRTRSSDELKQEQRRPRQRDAWDEQIERERAEQYARLVEFNRRVEEFRRERQAAEKAEEERLRQKQRRQFEEAEARAAEERRQEELRAHRERVAWLRQFAPVARAH